MDKMPIRLHAIVEGRVQGVGFRYFVLQYAQELNLVGWVRNMDNGDVEVTAEGDQSTLVSFVEYLKRGPSSAFVSNVRVDWLEARGEYKRFGVISGY
jgi:acylphosphatase